MDLPWGAPAELAFAVSKLQGFCRASKFLVIVDPGRSPITNSKAQPSFLFFFFIHLYLFFSFCSFSLGNQSYAAHESLI